uniref:Uncharacterized protein n=1 Tax=Hanusia phi TaxID=3032 RepID=A0A7S0EJE1_9CRYP
MVGVQGFVQTGVPGGLKLNRIPTSSYKDISRRPQVALRAHSMHSLFDAATLMAADVSEAANTVDTVVAEQSPGIQIFGQNIAGIVLILVPISGAFIIFSILAWIITNTMVVPKDMFKRK